MTYQKDQERKNKILTWISIGVLILAVLPIVLFAIFSVVTAKNPPVRTSSSIEEPTLSRSEIRRLEREKKKAEEEAAKQTVTQNQPVITTETMPQMGQFPGMGQFGPGMMGPGQFGNFDPSQMPQFDPSQFQGMGFGQFGNFDPANMPQFDPSQFQGMGMGFGQGMQFDPSQFQGMQGGFGPGMNNNGAGFMDANGAWNSPPFNPNGGGPNIIADPVQSQPQILPAPAGNQQIMINPIRDQNGNPMINANTANPDLVRPRIGIPAQN